MSLYRLILGILVGVVMASSAMATDSLSVRLSDHQQFVRLVLSLDAGTLPDSTVRTIDDQTVEISFKGAMAAPVFKPAANFPEIVDVRVVSQSSEPLKLWVMLAKDGFARDLRVGNRQIIDIKQNKDLREAQKRAAVAKIADEKVVAAKPTEKSIPVEPTKVQTQPAATAPAPAPALAPIPTPTPTPTPTSAVSAGTTASTKANVPVETNIQAPTLTPAIIAANPVVITLTSTEAFGLASFIHNRKLWIIVDQPDFLVTPRMAGSGVGALGTFERIKQKDSTIYTLKLPDGYLQMRGEGGDLYWRVVLAPPKPDTKPVEPLRGDKDGQRVLLWPFKQVGKIIHLMDPDTDEQMVAVTVQKSNEFSGPARSFAEFFMPNTGVGLAVVPHVDDLDVTTYDDAIAIVRQGGLSITSALEAQAYKSKDLPEPPSAYDTLKDPNIQPTPEPMVNPSSSTSKETGALPLFRFDRWAMGGADSIASNEQMLVNDLITRPVDERASGYMNLGKMYLANAQGSEALGYFNLAADAQAGLADTPDFHGLRGAAQAMNGQFDLAYENLRNSGLDSYPDSQAWRAYALANLQDWKQARERMAGDYSWLRQYPQRIAMPMLLTFAEIALRAGDTKNAQKMMDLVDPSATATNIALVAPFVAQRDYLRGEAARQAGRKEEARKLWQDLLKTRDRKYKARARLALTVLDYEDGKLKVDTAIDNLEGLRYAWRGDELEASINARLGDLYLDKGDYLRGLNVLRDAAGYAPDTDTGRKITTTMTETFKSLFIGDTIKKIDPLDAITIYEKFSELAPSGEESSRLTLSLVDRLMEVDLLDRAIKVLQELIDHRLTGDEKIVASLRLSAIYLINRQPQQALVTLSKTAELFGTLTNPDIIVKRKRELGLLRARAQFGATQTEAALSTLEAIPEDVDVLRSKADIAWQTGRWGDAASALERLMSITPIPQDRPPTSAQAELIRNLAVATNLSGDRGRLAQLRQQYGQLMSQTEIAQQFDVITRERQTPTLADRDTLNKVVSEVDMFGGFLDSYRASEKPVVESKPASTPVAATEKTAEALAPEPDTATKTP
jgi:tetratricopeptide (TPR) repeat protein